MALRSPDHRAFAFDAADVQAIQAAVGAAGQVNDPEALRVDLTNSFYAFETDRSNTAVYSVSTGNAIAALSKSARKTQQLLDIAIADRARLTWLLNKAWSVWPDGDRRLFHIQAAMKDLRKLMVAPEAFTGLEHAIGLEVKFIGMTLPQLFEQHFKKAFTLSRTTRGQTPSSAGIKFVLACLERKKTLNSNGKPFAPETVVAHRSKALKLIRANPQLAVGRTALLRRIVA